MLNFETRPDHRRPLIVIAAGNGMAPLDRPMTTGSPVSLLASGKQEHSLDASAAWLWLCLDRRRRRVGPIFLNFSSCDSSSGSWGFDNVSSSLGCDIWFSW
ncbi:hypothetical protein NL676_030673 [Syzygium grande]|nr:hypothetical protein NL676_030673 [Syzygium grande]